MMMTTYILITKWISKNFYVEILTSISENTSSPKGNDRSHESNVPRSNLISKTYKRAFMPVLFTSKFDYDLKKTERASMETAFSHYKSMGNSLDLKGS